MYIVAEWHMWLERNKRLRAHRGFNAVQLRHFYMMVIVWCVLFSAKHPLHMYDFTILTHEIAISRKVVGTNVEELKWWRQDRNAS